MSKLVIKKDGSKISFDKVKIERSVRKAANDANLNPEEINKLMNDISCTMEELSLSESKISTKEIREKILVKLDEVSPVVSAEWRKYEGRKR